jgi:hypothetical protein
MGANGGQRDHPYFSIAKGTQAKQEATMGNRGTWWFDSGGLVGWSYRPMARSDGQLVPLDLQDWNTRRRWLGDVVGRLPVLLGDFGSVDVVHVGARGKGQGDCVFNWPDEKDSTGLLAFLRQAQTELMQANLNLSCLDRDLKPIEVVHGATLWINMWADESGSLDLTSDTPVYLRFVLNADIYAYWSLGDVQDNAFLAALNGPRLTALLERIERDVPAQLLDMDGERYGGLVGPHGFTAPGPAFRGA